MLEKYLILAFLLTIAHARITINVKPHTGGADIDYRGDDEEMINKNERNSFRLNDENLKKATKVVKGKSCTDIFLKPPTPWGDVYKKHGWQPVKSKIKPFYSRVISVSSKEVSLGEREYKNNNDKETTYHINIIKDVLETVAHIWTKERTLGEGREVDYNIKFGDLSVGGNTKLSYSAPWGDGPMKSRLVTIGKKTSTTVSLPPGGKTKATLMATHHRVEIEIRYEDVLEGDVFCNYKGGYKGHNFYAFHVKELQRAARTPLSMYAIETIILGFYTEPHLEMSG